MYLLVLLSLSLEFLVYWQFFLYSLRGAITLEPKYREGAKKNPYFQAYRDKREFKEILSEQSLN